VVPVIYSYLVRDRQTAAVPLPAPEATPGPLPTLSAADEQ